MLQPPLQLPPLSLSPPSNTLPLLEDDYFRPNDPTLRIHSSSLAPKRFPMDSFGSRSVFAPPQLPISATNYPSSPSASSPSPASSQLPCSPYISSRQLSNPVSLPAKPQTWTPKLPELVYHSRPSSVISSITEDVLAPGDCVGEDCFLQGELIRLVSIGVSTIDFEAPVQEFEVVRRLGTGSYAVVYLVREVLSRPPPSEDGHSSLFGQMELEGRTSHQPSIQYGREYALKCLSKANLDEEALAAQMSEVTIHQSLRSHPNIATLHRTLETSSFLLLLLEYVPGEDLYYFLEQARDHYEMDSPSSAESHNSSSSRTPPTPTLLSTLHPSQLLSRTRLRLISSMFSQMCDAVAACHAQQVFHRDIKPENFIVTDGFATLADGRRERKVVVKLTDFGLSTTDLESSDMDCGSAPYMSYECRNNVAPTYRPRAADVWSLGIVLANMLYHYNPWTDTTDRTCSSFDAFRQQPVAFFLQRFAGMTYPVAEFLANNVFCILNDPKDDSQRISASEFGAWVKDLPALLGEQSGLGHKRVISGSSTQGHPISSSVRQSHRPSSRQASGTPAMRTPAIRSRSLSRAPSRTALETEPSELSTVFDQDFEEPEDVESASRSTSTTKHRKRGARKGKGSNASPTIPQDETLATLAVASQSLAREISKASRTPSAATTMSRSSRHRPQPFEPVSMYPIPVQLLSIPSPPLSTSATVGKKTSKWKLSFGKSSGAASAPPLDEPASPVDFGREGAMSATATNVTNLLMGLNAPVPQSAGSSQKSDSRGRRPRPSSSTPNLQSNSRSRGRSGHGVASPSPHTSERWADRQSERAASPASTRSGRRLQSSASSMSSANWRASTSTTSSAGTSTSAFTRYSNASLRSVETMATSVSSSSWRTHEKMPSSPPAHGNSKPAPIPPVPALPKNIKYMTGVPWELDQPPRGLYPDSVTHTFGSPPVRKQRARKPKDVTLDTISERPATAAGPKSPTFLRQDASTSTTDLSGVLLDDGDGPKKVPKGQINALAKMLSALRR